MNQPEKEFLGSLAVPQTKDLQQGARQVKARICQKCYMPFPTTRYTGKDPYCPRCMEASYSGPFWREQLSDDENELISSFVIHGHLSYFDIRRALIDYQGETCAICGAENVPLGIDHDHHLGFVRGLLCSACNHGIGHFRDDENLLKSAIAYLRQNYSDHTKVPYKPKTYKQSRGSRAKHR